MEPVPIKSYAELVELLHANGLETRTDPKAQSIAIATPEADLANRILVRWEPTYPFVQIIQPMIGEVPAERVAAVESAICRLNNIAKVAGLGYDRDARLIYYRTTLVVLRDGIRADLFQALLHGAVINAKELLGPLRAVIGGAAPEGVVGLVATPPTG